MGNLSVMSIETSKPHTMIGYLFSDSFFIKGMISASLIGAMKLITDVLSPFAGFLAICVGVIIGILTIWKLTIEIRMKTREYKRSGFQKYMDNEISED
jgi:hypothetical protein